jgi:cytosine/uracil/thiamine/allantoin permease
LKKFRDKSLTSKEKYLLGGGILCILFMIINKALSDEIGRESQAGISITGEYIIFNILLLAQLLFIISSIQVIRKIELQKNEN